MTVMTASSTPRATEKECQSTIVEAARMLGWLVYHNRTALNSRGRYLTAIQGDSGFPDLVLAHPKAGRILFIELKRPPNRLSEPQRRWIEGLIAAGGIARIVRVPEEQQTFIDELASLSRPT